MSLPANWHNPITASPGQLQVGVDPHRLLPSTPIQVTLNGVIWDGQHAVRIAAEKGRLVTVKVVKVRLNPTASSVMDLPVS